MDERTKLSGIARLSPRLRLLARLSQSENPILSISATHLLRDRTARRVGGFFEFTFLVLLPLSALVIAGATCMEIIYRAQHPNTWGNLIPATEPTKYLSYASGYLLRLIAFTYGFIILMVPGVTISKREADGSLLRFLPVERNEVFRGMAKLQLASFFLAPAIFYLFDVATALPVLMLAGFLGLQYFEYILIPPWPLEIKLLLAAWMLLALLYMSIYSIHPSFRYRLVWPSFIAMCAGCLIFGGVVFGGASWLVTQAEFPYYNDWMKPFLIRVVILISVFFVTATFFGLGAIRYRINPLK